MQLACISVTQRSLSATQRSYRVEALLFFFERRLEPSLRRLRALRACLRVRRRLGTS